MRLFFSLLALLISVTMMVIYTNSFTTAAIKNEATLSISSEESALIAINYTENKNIQLSNNTDKSIVVKNINLVSDPKHKVINASFPFSLPSGHSQEFIIANYKRDLSGNVMTVSVHWNGGTADIKSTIPKLEIDEITPESIEELIEPAPNIELEEDDEN